MLVNRIQFSIITMGLMILLCIMLENPLLAGVITFMVVMIGYIVIALYKQKRRMNLLEKYCDPDAFIEATEKQRKITGKNKKLNTYMDIDIAVGCMLLGDWKSGKEKLLSVDKTKLPAKSGAMFVYTVDMISCLYALGEHEEAEKLYEKHVPLLAPVTKGQMLTMRMLMAYRLQENGNFLEAKCAYEKLLAEKLSVRQRAGVLFDLGKIDEELGNGTLALEKYSEVARIGNCLWIAQQARKKLTA